MRQAEEAALAADNAFAARRNAEIDEAQKTLERERDAAAQPDRDRLLAIEDDLGRAHLAACGAVADTGAKYDDANSLDERCILRHERTPLENLAGRIDQPMPDNDPRSHILPWLSWALVIVTGALIGLSLGVITHLYAADDA